MRLSIAAPCALRGRLRSAYRTSRIAAVTWTAVAVACADPQPGDSPGTPVSAASIEVVDDGGHTVRLAAPAHRIISLIPAQTEVVHVLGGVDRLLARTQWDTDPRLAHLPSIGNALTPSVEWIVARQPDLIIAWTDGSARTIVERMRGVGLTVYASRVESLDEIESMIERVGTLLGRREAADSLNASIEAQLDSVRGAVAGLEPPDVLYLIGRDPVSVAGAGTFVGQLVEIAGGRNIFADLPQFYPQVSLEEVLVRDPDVIIRPTIRPRTPAEAAADLRSRPGWSGLRAVREGRVYEIDVDFYNRPGITVGRAARGLAELIHPGAFQ